MSAMKCRQCETEVELPSEGVYSAVFCSEECHNEFWAWWDSMTNDGGDLNEN